MATTMTFAADDTLTPAIAKLASALGAADKQAENLKNEMVALGAAEDQAAKYASRFVSGEADAAFRAMQKAAQGAGEAAGREGQGRGADGPAQDSRGLGRCARKKRRASAAV